MACCGWCSSCQGETVVSADTTIGYLHTGIEKTAEQKKWQQVIPLVERMDYLGAQSNSLAFCLAVEKLLGIEVPERVRNIRVLIAELQRITSHLVWLGTHGLEIGAVSVMMYCFREREQLLNVNEMLAGFRMFPSYLRIGGLREDLPTGFHEAVKKFLDAFPGQAEGVRGSADAKPDLVEADADRSASSPRIRPIAYGLVGPMARAAGVPYDVRKAFPYLGYETYDFDVPVGTAGDVYDRYLVRMEEMRQSTRIAQQALARISPRGVYDIQDYRIVPPPKDKVYTEMEGLIQHFLIYSQGFTVPAGESYVPIEGPRGEHGFSIVSDGTQSSVSHQAARAVVLRLPGAAACDRRRHDCRRDRRHRLDRCRHGRRGSMSFHPLMVYDSAALPEVGARAPRRREAVRVHPRAPRHPRRHADEVSARPEAVGRTRRAVSRPGAGGIPDGERHASRRRHSRHDGGRGRRRRDLLRDVLPGACRQVRAAGLPHAFVRAEWRRTRDRSALGEAGNQGRRDRCRRACSR